MLAVTLAAALAAAPADAADAPRVAIVTAEALGMAPRAVADFVTTVRASLGRQGLEAHAVDAPLEPACVQDPACLLPVAGGDAAALLLLSLLRVGAVVEARLSLLGVPAGRELVGLTVSVRAEPATSQPLRRALEQIGAAVPRPPANEAPALTAIDPATRPAPSSTPPAVGRGPLGWLLLGGAGVLAVTAGILLGLAPSEADIRRLYDSYLKAQRPDAYAPVAAATELHNGMIYAGWTLVAAALLAAGGAVFFLVLPARDSSAAPATGLVAGIGGRF